MSHDHSNCSGHDHDHDEHSHDDHGHDHSGHDHSGHDHGDDHDEHDHDHSHDDHGHDHDHSHDDHGHDGHDHPHPPKAKEYPLTEDEIKAGFVMLTKDGGIKKKILVESTEKHLGTPPDQSQVTCHYTGTLPSQNDEKFDSSRDRGDPFGFKIGTSSVIKGWDVGIATMHKGEKCILRCGPEYAYGEQGSGKIGPNETLDFEVEMIEWDTWQEIQGGDLKKKILFTTNNKEDDNHLNDDDEVNIDYKIFWMNDDDKQENILCSRTNSTLLVGDDDQFSSSFHSALGSMKNGEKALFKIINKQLIDDVFVSDNELKENETNNNSVRAPDDKLTLYEIKINSHSPATEKWKAENEERISFGLKYKNNGNVLFKESRFTGALSKYNKAIDWVDIDFSDENLLKEKNKIIIDCNNNSSLICIKRKNYREAVKFAGNALDEDLKNVKALMRRGQAFLYLNEFNSAKKDLQKAKKLDSKNSYIKKLLKICIKKKKEAAQKQAKLYAKMFDGNSTKKKKKNKNKNLKEEKVETKIINEDKKQQEQEVQKMDVDVEKSVDV